jgi:potassium/sodium efflux P-type ATPase
VFNLDRIGEQVMMPPHSPVWSLPSAEVYEALGTSQQGLSLAEVTERQRHYGFNELPEQPGRSLWLKFIDQLTHFMALLLWVAGILAFIANTPELGWAIWAVIWINALFSFWQEFQAEKAMAALKNILPTQVKVYRDGTLQVVLAKELVPGDVIQLEEGDRISADGRLVQAESVYIDASVLTGESLPVLRHSHRVRPRRVVPVQNGAALLHPGEQTAQERIPPAEISNLVLAGSSMAAGRGIAVVYATGAQTEFGQVAHLTTTVRRETSTLEVQISHIVRVITAIALSVGGAVFLLTWLFVGLDIRESFTFTIGIIVALVPEGLLPTVTLALAIGVQRMAKRNALVRRLSAVETLSATTVICTDKTGTLTKNEMTVRSLWIPTQSSAEPSADRLDDGSSYIEVTGVGYEPIGEVRLGSASEKLQNPVQLLLTGAALCSNARLVKTSAQWKEIGDPTEAALIVAAMKAGLNLDTLQKQAARKREVPFDSRRRMMSVVLDWQLSGLWQNDHRYLCFTKGAPLEVLRHCTHQLSGDKVFPLEEPDRTVIAAANDELARQGFRVLAIAARRGNEEVLKYSPYELERELIFIGLAGMVDPARPEAMEAIAQCHQAGIAVTMITGDYGITAAAIAQNIGLVKGKARVVTGEELGHLSDAQLRQTLQRHHGLVFARMAPEQKLRVVETYKALGEIVAVTGDGVNDAPALRSAHIGIAMGLNGTDVAREAADIVLLDDNFATIVSAIEQGRAVYQNIRKFMSYILASNLAEVIPFMAMIAFKIPPALTILQILAVDLGTDMVPALALGAEPAEPGMMAQRPRKASQRLLDRSLMLRAYGFLGLIEAIASMSAFAIVWGSYGYSLSDLQAITPKLLTHVADRHELLIYAQATTLTLVAIVACQDGNVFACRSERASIFQLGFFSNPFIWIGIGIEWILISMIIFLEPLHAVFNTTLLAGWQWLLLLLCPILLLGAEELRKALLRKVQMRKVQTRRVQSH